MKKTEVKIGSTYLVKVSGKLAHVRITAATLYGGWIGISLATQRAVRFRTAARLRSEVKLAGDGRIEQIRNLRAQGISFDVAKQIVKAEYDRPETD